MSDRLYKPGSKDKRRFNPQGGRISKNRFAWLRTHIGQLVIMRYRDEDEPDSDDPKPDKEVGTSYTLLIPQPGRKPVVLNITSLTMAEFQKTRQLFNLLFDLAEPVIRERDKVAQDAFANGDDSFTRLYREVPTFIVREGQERTDLQGVQHGPAGVPDGSGGGADQSRGLRGNGDELADRNSTESVSQDDGPETDQP